MASAPAATRHTPVVTRDRDLPHTPVLAVDGLTKVLGGRRVLDGLSFSVPTGEIFGLIGPSGCGKTTLVRVLAGLSSPTSGGARVWGTRPLDFTTRQRENIGYVPQSFVLYPTLTVMENARFVAGLYGVAGWRKRRRRIRETLQLLDLWDARGRLAREISGGMQRRLALAAALFHEPSVLFIDEPTSGLDPLLRGRVWEHLRALRDRGATLLVTTQHMDEASYCDRIGLLHDGRLIASGTADELRHEALGGEAIDVEAPQFDRGDIAALWQLPCVSRVQWNGGRELRLRVDDIGEATAAITRTLAGRGTQVDAVRSYTPTFDEVFVELVNR